VLPFKEKHMAEKRVAVAITEEAEGILSPLIKLMKTVNWSDDRLKPICLVCEYAELTGQLFEVRVLTSKEGSKATMRLWLPPNFILLAFDFSQARKFGFG